MRSPAELGDVDWPNHQGGWAVPPLIRMLYADRAQFDSDEFFELEQQIYNLGCVYPATALALPFLVHAALHSEFFAETALSLLSWIAHADGVGEVEIEVYDALVAVAPELLPCLDSGNPRLEREALHVLGACAHSLGADTPRVIAGVLGVFENDLDREVVSDALTALLLLENEAAFLDRVEQALTAIDPVVRLTGLLCALEAGYVHDLTERAEFVDEAGRLAVHFSEAYPGFPGLGTREDRAHRAFHALQAVYRDGP